MHSSKPPNGPKALFQAIRLISPDMHIFDITTLPYRAQASKIVNGYLPKDRKPLLLVFRRVDQDIEQSAELHFGLAHFFFGVGAFDDARAGIEPGELALD